MLLLLFLAGTISAANAQSGRVIPDPSPSAPPGKAELAFDKSAPAGLDFHAAKFFPVLFEPYEPQRSGGEIRAKPAPYVELKGTFGIGLDAKFQEPTLTCALRPVVLDSEKNFQVRVPLTGPKTEVSFVAISALGEVKRWTGTLTLSPSEYDRLMQDNLITRANALEPSPWRKSVGLGLSDLQNLQSGTPDFQEWALTLKAAVSYRLNPLWDVAVGGYYTVLVLGSNEPGVHANFLGVNLRAGYMLTPSDPHWRVAISGGIYYLTSFVTNDLFGPYNLIGPQLFPSATYLFSNQNSASAYIKYSPVSSVGSLGDLSDHELAFGLSYRFAPKESHGVFSHPVDLTLDISSLHLNILGLTATTSSYNLGVAYGF
jgi:hypothetical protein